MMFLGERDQASLRSVRSLGITVVELLIAMFVLITVLAISSVFFGQQVQLRRNVENRNDVQDRARVVSQLVAQDLALAGNPLTISANGSPNTTIAWPGCFTQASGGRSCLELTNVDATTSALRIRYVSSQFPSASSCRDVSYRVQGALLQRSDVACASTADFVDLVPGVLGFKVTVVCSNGTRFDSFPNAGCVSGTAYGRSAVFSFGGQSEGEVSGGPSDPVQLVTSTPNGAGGYAFTSVNCQPNRACFGMTQEVLMPNLKDQ